MCIFTKKKLCTESNGSRVIDTLYIHNFLLPDNEEKFTRH